MSVTTTTTSANSTETNNQKHITEFSCKIWQIAENHLIKVKAQVFFEYVGCLFFYRFISENLTYYLNKKEQITNPTNPTDPSFNYTQLSDDTAEILREQTLKEKGFFIPPSLLFENVLSGIKNSFYFIPDLSYPAFYITVGDYTYEEIDSKSNITNVSALIESVFDEVYFNATSILSSTEMIDFFNQWTKLFNPVYNEFLELGDTRPFKMCEKEEVPILIDTIERKNERLIKIMNAVASIPLEDLVKETIDYDLKAILKIQKELMGK